MRITIVDPQVNREEVLKTGLVSLSSIPNKKYTLIIFALKHKNLTKLQKLHYLGFQIQIQ